MYFEQKDRQVIKTTQARLWSRARQRLVETDYISPTHAPSFSFFKRGQPEAIFLFGILLIRGLSFKAIQSPFV